MVKFQDDKARAEPTKQQGSGQSLDCTATAFSPTAVLLTWNSGNIQEIENTENFTIYYRPLYLLDDFSVLQAGKQLHYLVENLDVRTYYMFRVGTNDSSGNYHFCEVSVKTLRDASLSVPLRIIKSSKGLHAKWKAVTLPQDSQAIYRLFVEWRNKGKPHVRLLYEGNQTSSNLQDKLPIPSRMYVSIVVKQADSTTNFEHQAGSIITYPTKQALIPATLPLKPNNPAIEKNKTLLLNLTIDAYGWNFVKITWNAITVEGTFVTYKISCRSTEKLLEVVTSNTSAFFSNLRQLTRYQISLEAQGHNETLSYFSAEAYLTTFDRNECADVPSPCLAADHSECVNTRGSYFCRCSSGWIGDGKTCKEIPDNKGKISYCEKRSYANVTWPTTLPSQTALAPCPTNSRGTAKRACVRATDDNAKWGVPDLSKCVSDKMAELTQQLRNPNADLTDIAKQLEDITSVDKLAHGPLLTGDLRRAVDVITVVSQRDFDGHPKTVKNEKIQRITQAVVKSTSNILDDRTLENWKFMPKDFTAAEASKILKGVDAVALSMAKAANSSGTFFTEAPNVVLSAKLISQANPPDQQMSPKFKEMGSTSSVMIPGSVIKLQHNDHKQSETHFITFVAYRNLKALMQPGDDQKSSAELTTDKSDVGRINSDVVSISVHPLSINSFDEPVTLIIKNTKTNFEDETSCVFWNMSSAHGFWSDTGCRVANKNSSHTTCHCYHLTSFAVLMRVKHPENTEAMKQHSFALSLISYIGISISIAALSLSFITFTFLRFRNTRQRYFVHANLALSLALAETLFLFGVSKTTHKIVCKAIAITMHYLFLVSFAWMALEGVVLYLMLVKIFRSKSRPARDKAVFLLCGWGIPAVIVAGSTILFHEGYGTREFCWLSIEGYFIWAFVGPVLLVCLFNFICLVKTFMVMSRRGRVKKTDTSFEKIRYWSKGCALLSCLLGLTWIVGVFVVNEDTMFMAYLFNIFNTLQGLLIFLFHCIGDEKVRAEYLQFLRCQTRAMAYGMARPWWSKSDSISRSKASDKMRRSTLQSNVELPKVTIDNSVKRRTTVMTGPEYTALRQSIKMSQMYGITEDDCEQNSEGRQIAENLTDTHAQNSADCDEVQSLKNSEEIVTDAVHDHVRDLSCSCECTCEQTSQPNLPDLIKHDADKNEDDKETLAATAENSSTESSL
ncbi:the G-protein coupled receptor 2 [Porites harrisoni]